jgi:hypothetical protein
VETPVAVTLIVLVPDPAQTASGATGCPETEILGGEFTVIKAVAVRVGLGQDPGNGVRVSA